VCSFRVVAQLSRGTLETDVHQDGRGGQALPQDVPTLSRRQLRRIQDDGHESLSALSAHNGLMRERYEDRELFRVRHVTYLSDGYSTAGRPTSTRFSSCRVVTPTFG